ncbi:hypothetical protein DFH06DRAFT_1125138 [Mycena polygramma]|nr:hypothetical protein DFH06DRAFT_1125138 [Mycena polygramma]
MSLAIVQPPQSPVAVVSAPLALSSPPSPPSMALGDPNRQNFDWDCARTSKIEVRDDILYDCQSGPLTMPLCWRWRPSGGSCYRLRPPQRVITAAAVIRHLDRQRTTLLLCNPAKTQAIQFVIYLHPTASTTPYGGFLANGRACTKQLSYQTMAPCTLSGATQPAAGALELEDASLALALSLRKMTGVASDSDIAGLARSEGWWCSFAVVITTNDASDWWMHHIYASVGSSLNKDASAPRQIGTAETMLKGTIGAPYE